MMAAAPGPSTTADSLSSHSIFQSTSKARLQALYSDFARQKQSNPSAFHANVEWWRKTLEGLLDSGLLRGTVGDSESRLVLQADRSLLDCVKLDKIGKPLAIGTVVNELRSNNTLLLLNEFMSSKVSVYDSGWLPYRIASFVVGRPLWWALEQVGIVGDEGILTSSSQTKETVWWGDYVSLPLVEKAADAVMSMQAMRMTGPADTLYTFEGFRRSFGPIFGESNHLLNDMDARVLVKYLERERKAMILDDQVVKFFDSSVALEDRVITTVDRGILELKSAILNLQHQIDAVQTKMDDYAKKAADALQQKRKILALGFLRSRKQLEDLLGKRLSSLSTLEGTMVSIETAAGDVQIMKTFESSTTTLRTILAHSSLQRENINQTMDALAEASQDAKEVDDAIRIGGNVALGVEISDEEIERELEALAKDVENSSDTLQTLEQLRPPSVLVETTDATDKVPLLSH
ncbi:hypothetical protein Agabi119p4_2947 [Agaricus bisporus var. burnettii]|uniref:Charged multivesicular body protein 7 n=1 Tax=Agaricus bisporus var. burnettii TaxID=192524 RepID=A0A8H7F649_AGABI|nr:hypothetical protein Agabi119p4_2947 [Agaricus bisporus var. burnettii]